MSDWHEDALRHKYDPLPEDGPRHRKRAKKAHVAWKCIHTGASCSDCRMIAGGCTLQTAMRELGIEVDA